MPSLLVFTNFIDGREVDCADRYLSWLAATR